MTYALNNIPVDLIEDNSKNFYSIEGVQELAENIRTVGLLHPIRVVRAPGGTYRCVDGHRRLSAYRVLAEEDEGFQNVPAYEVPVMDDLEEQTMLLMANANNRQMTTADLHRQEAELRQLLEARRAAGKPVPKNLSQYMASVLGVSRNEVSRMHTTNTGLIPEGKQLLEEGKLNASAAYDLARKPDAEQRAAVAAIAPAPQTATDAVPQTVRDYQAEEAARAKNLVRLAGRYAGKYLTYGLKTRLRAAVYRKDVIDAFKEAARTAIGHSDSELRYGYTSTHIDIADNSGSANASITEFADAVMVATLRAYASKQLREETEVRPTPASKMDTGWRKGHPADPCWCVCRVFEPGMRNGIYCRLWWGGQKWNGLPGADLLVTHWTPEPEEDGNG